jgi:hypothetical protein
MTPPQIIRGRGLLIRYYEPAGRAVEEITATHGQTEPSDQKHERT